MGLTSLCAVLLAMGCRKDEAKQALPAPLVRTVQVEGAATGQFELRGSVAAEGRLKLGFKQAGVVASILVREGDRVRKGQLLATQDDVDAVTLGRTAQAAVEKARRDAARAERLVADGALPASTRDDAKTALEAAEAQLAQVMDLQARTRLMAPVAGTIFARIAEPGETLGAGTPLLLLDSTDDMVVRTGVSEREAAFLRPGQKVAITLEGEESWREGRVRTVGASPNPADGLYALEVAPVPRGYRAGALVRLRFPNLRADPCPSIPLEALVRREDRDHVFVLENGRVRMRPVKVLRSEGRRVLVREGVKPGERLVGEGAYFLQDGQTVRVAE